MEIELHPAVSTHPRDLQCPDRTSGGAGQSQCSHLDLQRYKLLNICGRSSRRLDRKFTELEIRRAFTVFQLMTILVENHHSFLIVEHDPMLYEDAGHMAEYIAQALKQTSREATILFYSPGDRIPSAEDDGAGRSGDLHLRRAGERAGEGRGEDAG
jgi:hypothetical protein